MPGTEVNLALVVFPHPQHIEDLTQEKFALQRGAEAARALAASLEEENSRLTEDFNRQAQAVQTLKADLERQQAEIKAQQVCLDQLFWSLT